MPLWGKADSQADKPKWYTTLGSMDTANRQLIFIDNTEASLAVNRARGFNSPGWWSYFTVEQSDGTLRYRGQECLVAISQTAANAGDQADDAVAADSAPTPITISVQPTNQTTVEGRIYFQSLTNSGTTLVGQANQTYILTGLAGSAAGTGAGFTFNRGSDGHLQSYALSAVGKGVGFVAGETITILGSLVGGVNTTDNLLITVNSIESADATFSVTAAGQATLQYQWQRQAASATTWTNITNAGVFSTATTATLQLTAATKAVYNGYKFRVRVTSTGGATTVISNSASLTYA
jgi:hypothetical protein